MSDKPVIPFLFKKYCDSPPPIIRVLPKDILYDNTCSQWKKKAKSYKEARKGFIFFHLIFGFVLSFLFNISFLKKIFTVCSE